ncbi:translation initiation factor IF-2-like [Choloepus didactylus]|uniref:translation initiation factor IF-2-like n=1 Tax=Choloepus didactylus TaxID=27675 RepID=UPI00189FF50A|nr:translation initiation factor IF-2-like [Choloepus didactylus]
MFPTHRSGQPFPPRGRPGGCHHQDSSASREKTLGCRQDAPVPGAPRVPEGRGLELGPSASGGQGIPATPSPAPLSCPQGGPAGGAHPPPRSWTASPLPCGRPTLPPPSSRAESPGPGVDSTAQVTWLDTGCREGGWGGPGGPACGGVGRGLSTRPRCPPVPGCRAAVGWGVRPALPSALCPQPCHMSAASHRQRAGPEGDARCGPETSGRGRGGRGGSWRPPSCPHAPAARTRCPQPPAPTGRRDARWRLAPCRGCPAPRSGGGRAPQESAWGQTPRQAGAHTPPPLHSVRVAVQYVLNHTKLFLRCLLSTNYT